MESIQQIESECAFQACAEADLMEHLLRRLPTAGPLVVDLLVELMGILASYSITVKELKALFSAMKAVDEKWVSPLLHKEARLVNIMRCCMYLCMWPVSPGAVVGMVRRCCFEHCLGPNSRARGRVGHHGVFRA